MITDANQREYVIERPQATEPNWHYRPKPARGDFLVDWPVYFVSRHSLNSSRKTEFGASGHCRISTSDVSNIAAGRRFQKCDSARTPRCCQSRTKETDVRRIR